MRTITNLIESEIRRPRGDGLTTELYQLAKKLKYKFVISERQIPHVNNGEKDSDIITYNKDFRWMQGGFIWDHYAIHLVALEAQHTIAEQAKEIERLEGENLELLKEKNKFIEAWSSSEDKRIAVKDQLTRAKEVIRFYGDKDKFSPQGLLEAKDKSSEYVPLGTKAREFLKEVGE